MNTDTLVHEIAGKIQTKIAEGSEALKNPALRAEINEIPELKHQDEKLLGMDSTALMTEFAKALIKIWPQTEANYFKTIIDLTIPLTEIRVFLNSEELNKHVQVRSDSWVMKDPRIPLEDFKKKLLQELFSRQNISETKKTSMET